MIIAVVVVVNDDDVVVDAAKVILKVLRKYIELAKNMVLKFNSHVVPAIYFQKLLVLKA